MKHTIILTIIILVCGGCSAVKRAPDASQKLNALLLNKTTSAAAEIAKEQNADQSLSRLIELASMQSEAVLEYYGKGDEDFDISVEQLLGEEVEAVSKIAYENAAASNQPARAVNDIIEIAIGVCGLIGGAFGVKAAAFLNAAKTKTTALEEIICGNEKFKNTYPQYSKYFKKSQDDQSQSTRELVTKIKDKA
jgi:hypothetical protein